MSTETPNSDAVVEQASNDPVDRVIHYHIRTKHHYNRYARSLGFLDWVNQPDPFRRFKGAELIPLPLLRPEEEPVSPGYAAMYEHGAVPVQAVTMRTLSRFFELALALSAWKKAGQSEWALRSNPSSGNLHPTEGYVVMPQIGGLDLTPGLYHYAPKEHGLERRADFPIDQLAQLLGPFPAGAFLFGLTSVHWREAWKYGERAFRYCNHDIGHAIGTARIAAATLGWSMMLLEGMDQHTVALLLGTDRTADFAEAEAEHPDCLAVIWGEDVNRQPSLVNRSESTIAVRGEGLEGRRHEEVSGKTLGVKGGECAEIPLFLDVAMVKEVTGGTWHGRANLLSREHGVHWDVIDTVAEASWKFSTDNRLIALPSSSVTPHSFPLTVHGPLAGQIIRQRRSAVAYDGKTSITATAFFQMLQRVMPLADRMPLDRPMPWDAWPYDPAIHLLLFVHRVDGVRPGVYVLIRDQRKLSCLQQSLNQDLAWVPVPGCPEGLPLYWLLEGDARGLAVQVSCRQDIAGDSAFSLGMLAEFEGWVRERGAWCYPRLFWEAGLLGQVLYLEAEAAGVRATGIGCFFDDPVHEILAVKGLSLQSLYHFTIGGPVEDRRLQMLPPYEHVKREE